LASPLYENLAMVCKVLLCEISQDNPVVDHLDRCPRPSSDGELPLILLAMLWVAFSVSRNSSGGPGELLCLAHFFEELAALSERESRVVSVEVALGLLRGVLGLAQVVAF